MNLLADIPPPHVQRQRYITARRRLMGAVCREPSRPSVEFIDPDADDEHPPVLAHKPPLGKSGRKYGRANLREMLASVQHGHIPTIADEPPDPDEDTCPTLKEIISAVCREMNFTPAELTSHSRRPCFTPGRRVASYLCVTLTNQSKAAVARALGKAHHTTVSYHAKTMRGLLLRTARGYPPLRDELRIINAVDRITEQLTGEKR